MTATRTPSQRGSMSRRKGQTAERDLCRWLRSSGFPGAERAVRTGFNAGGRVGADPGDITGCPGLVVSVKDTVVEAIDKWMDELDDMTDNADWSGARGLLVQKRRGHADPGRWWCWLWQGTYLDLYRSWLENVDEVRQIPELPLWHLYGTEAPMRMELRHVVPLLHACGYGDPDEHEGQVPA